MTKRKKTRKTHPVVEQIVSKKLHFDIGEYFSRGWEIFQANMGLFTLGSLAYLVITTFFPEAAIISAPLVAGFFIVAQKVERGEEKVEFKQFFKGFDQFADLLIASILSTIITIIGLIFCVLPGIYFMIAFSFYIPFVVFLKMDAIDSLKASLKVVNDNFIGVSVFMLALVALNVAGILFCGIGLLITLPLTFTITYAAFMDIIEQAEVEPALIEAYEEVEEDNDEEEEEEVDEDEIEAEVKKAAKKVKKTTSKKSTKKPAAKKSSTKKTTSKKTSTKKPPKK